MPDRHVPILIVGGSLVGLSTSVLLAQYNVPHLVVESHAGTAIHPRAASFHQRTMEVYRSVGLQQEVEEAAARAFRQGGAIVAVESLGGKELAYFYRSYNEGVEGLSARGLGGVGSTIRPLVRGPSVLGSRTCRCRMARRPRWTLSARGLRCSSRMTARARTVRAPVTFLSRSVNTAEHRRRALSALDKRGRLIDYRYIVNR